MKIFRRRLQIPFFLLLLLALPLAGQAQYTYAVTNGQVTITGYSGPGGAVTVPATLNGLPVTGIAEINPQGPLQGLATLTGITIPNSVVSVGNRAFANCTSLTNVTLGSGIINLGPAEFLGDTALTTVMVNSGNHAYASVDGVLFNKKQTLLIQYPAGRPAGNYVVPASVTGLDGDAFQNCLLTNIALPNGLTNLGLVAFAYSTNLASLAIPKGVTAIDSSAFLGCTSLRAFTVAAGNPDYTSVGGVLFNKKQTVLVRYPPGVAGGYVIPGSVTNLEPNAFAQCAGLSGVTLPGGLTTLGMSVFAGCSGLTNIVLPNALTSVSIAAFAQCTGLASVTLGSGVTNLDISAFASDTNLAAIPLPDSLRNIGDDAFLSTHLTSLVIPDHVTRIGNSAFAQSWLRNVTIGNAVTNIGNFAFEQSGLTNVVFGSSLLSLGDGAFEYCYELADITLPASLVSIGDLAFQSDYLSTVNLPAGVMHVGAAPFGGSAQVTGITVDPANPAYTSVNGVLFNRSLTTLVEYTDSAGGSYAVPAGVTNIAADAFFYCPNLAGVTLPSGLLAIGTNAFDGCQSLTSVTLPDSVRVIAAGAFSGDYSLTNVTLGGQITSLEASAFAECFDLSGIALPASLTSIGDEAFNYCRSLPSITVPDGVTNLGAGVFQNCQSLTNVVLPAGLTSLGDNLFNGCAQLPGIVPPAGLTNIGNATFEYCGSLTNLALPAGVTSIGSYAFANSSLTGIILPAGLTSLGIGAFAWSGLTNVTLPASLTWLPSGVFNQCESLISVTIPASITSLGAQDFENCSSLTAVNFLGNAPLADPSAFINDTQATAFYLLGTSGWGSDFDGIPAVSSNGALQVTITPPAAVSAGAKWRVNGGTYQPSGATVNNLLATNAVVSFKPIPGWITPGSQTVAVVSYQTVSVAADYLDDSPPALSHLNLATGQHVSNSVFTVTGKASDNAGVAAVWYQLDNGFWTVATTTNNWTNWSASLPLTPGTNTLRTCAVDTAGLGAVYVADTDNNVIRQILPGGVVTTFAGGTNVTAGFADGPAGTALFSAPAAVATDQAGNVYVADTGNNCIRKITPAGFVTTLAGDTNTQSAGYADGPAGQTRFHAPASLVVDGSGNVYVADAGNNLIRKITPAGLVSTRAGNTNALTAGYADGAGRAALFNNPSGLALDGAGNLYVGDTGNSLIRKITPAGQVITLAGDTYDLTNGGYSEYNSAGYADGPGGAAKFTGPAGLAVDPFGDVVVADTMNNLIREISPGGLVTTIAGDIYALTNTAGNPDLGYAGNLGYADGPGPVALFYSPTAVSVDSAGNVLVADSGNDLIRGISPAGFVFTVAGDTNDLIAGNYNAGYADGTGGAALFFVPQGVTVDEAGANFSPTNTLIFDYIPSATLQVQVVGVGTVSPDYSNAVLALGGRYTMTATAKPGSGYVFTNWTLLTPAMAAVITNTATLKFTMVSNLTVTATFVDVQKPTESLVNLASGQRVSNSVYTVTGKAGDNTGVAAVWYQLNDGAWTLATTTNNYTNWFAALPLMPGTNTLHTYAQDVSGRQILYVGDRYNDLIRKITPAGLVSTLAGDTFDLTNNYGDTGTFENAGFTDGTGGLAQFDNPDGTAVDAAGNVYVADSQNNLIRKITLAGVVTTLAGDVYDLTNNGYQPVGPTPGNAGFADGPGDQAMFNYPTALALDGAGNLYVADTGNSLIRKITPDGMVSTVAGNTNVGPGYADGPAATAQFYQPYGIAVDGAGNIIVADTFNNLIREITPDGMVSTIAGDTNDLVDQTANNGYADGSGGAAQFSNPFGVAVDIAGNVYVGDVGNDLVRKITPVGLVTTLAGDIYDLTNGGYNPPMYNGMLNIGPNAGFADGPGAAAKFDEPCAVATDALGNLYVVDAGNELIRKITPAGVTTTVAGSTNNPPTAGYADGPAASAEFYMPPPGGISMDEGGANLSPTNTVTFNYIPSATLIVQTTGQGTISPDYSNAMLAVGSRYTMTARPAPGFVFNGWNLLNIFTEIQVTVNSLGQPNSPITNNIISPGEALTNGPTLSFVMTAPTILESVPDIETLSQETGYQANFVDVQKPELHITSPVPDQTVTSDSFLITGTASDNAAVASVMYQLNGGGWLPANGTNHWNAQVYLNFGTNTLRAYAIDTSGNVSATNTVNFVYVAKFELQVTIEGQGAVSPNYNGVPLQFGQSYSMTAKPAAGFGFVNWTAVQILAVAQPMAAGQVRPQDLTSLTPPPIIVPTPIDPIIPVPPPIIIPPPVIITNVTLLTNGPTLTFAMSLGLDLHANFADIAPPAVAITTPAPNQRMYNTNYTVSGMAKDNVGVAGVWFQSNGSGWQSASTGDGWTNWFTPGLPLLSNATNIIQAYAMDAAGNVSATDTVRFVNFYTDPAPASIAGTEALVFPGYGLPYSMGFGTNTFSLEPLGANQTPAVGGCAYLKFSSTQVHLIATNAMPPAVPVAWDLTFSSPTAGTYSNENTGETGSMTFSHVPELAPVSVAGKTVLLVNRAGGESQVAFGGATLARTNTAGLSESAAYSWQPYGVTAGLITVAQSDQTTNFVVLDYNNTNSGSYFSGVYDASGDLVTNDAGEFVFPSGSPAAPGTLAGRRAAFNLGGFSTDEIYFDAGTYSQAGFGFSPDSSVGTYAYVRQNATNGLLNLLAAIPGGTNLSYRLDFVAPGFCLVANAGDSGSLAGVATFYPAPPTEVLPSLGRATLYATNTAYDVNNDMIEYDIACHDGAFTQFETGGPNPGASSGTYAYAPYSPVLSLLTLKYTSPAGQAGATNYLEVNFLFDSQTNGYVNGVYFDNAGDSPVTSYGQFYIH